MLAHPRNAREGQGPPRSCTSYGTGLVGLIGFAAGAWAATSYDMPTAIRVLVVAAAAALPMVLWGIMVERASGRTTVGLIHGPAPAGDLPRLFVKLLGLPLPLLGPWTDPGRWTAPAPAPASAPAPAEPAPAEPAPAEPAPAEPAPAAPAAPAQ